MKVQIKWAELHSPLFLAGTNLGQKLDPAKRAGLVMHYCEDKKHLYVEYNKAVARVPEPSILSMIEGDMAAKPIAAPAPAKPVKAQVSTPQDHVFSGPGAGKMKF